MKQNKNIMKVTALIVIACVILSVVMNALIKVFHLDGFSTQDILQFLVLPIGIISIFFIDLKKFAKAEN